jgi:hypothetical protein
MIESSGVFERAIAEQQAKNDDPSTGGISVLRTCAMHE